MHSETKGTRGDNSKTIEIGARLGGEKATNAGAAKRGINTPATRHNTKLYGKCCQITEIYHYLFQGRLC